MNNFVPDGHRLAFLEENQNPETLNYQNVSFQKNRKDNDLYLKLEVHRRLDTSHCLTVVIKI